MKYFVAFCIVLLAVFTYVSTDHSVVDKGPDWGIFVVGVDVGAFTDNEDEVGPYIYYEKNTDTSELGTDTVWISRNSFIDSVSYDSIYIQYDSISLE